MEKEFIPYAEALELKELGFNEPCFGYYYPEAYSEETILMESALDPNHTYYNEFPNKGDLAITYNYNEQFISAPLYQQAFTWFREKYNLDKTIHNWTEQPMDGEIWDKAYQYFIDGEAYHPYFKTEEEAELECLKKLIEIVKEKK